MTLRCFGCSFTHGPTFLPIDQTWPTLVSQALDIDHKNYGQSGSSNEMIIDQYLQHRNDYDESDTFIFLLTYGHRYFKFNTERNRLEGTVPSHKDAKNFYKHLGDIEIWSNIKTYQNLLLLDRITSTNTFIFSIDVESIISCFNYYNEKINSFKKLYFWPGISIKSHITLEGHEGHPSADEQRIISDLMLKQIKQG